MARENVATPVQAILSFGNQGRLGGVNWQALRADELRASFLCASKVTLGPSPVTSDLAFLFPLQEGEGRTLMASGGRALKEQEPG